MRLNRKQKAQLGATVGVLAILAGGLLFRFQNIIFRADTYDGTPYIVLPVDNERFVYMNTPLIQGVSSQGSTVTIKDNNNDIGTVTADGNGKFYYKPTEGFADGTHFFVVNDSISGKNSNPTYVNFDTSDSSKAILKAQGTNIAENDHPYFGNGTNQYEAIVKMMGDPEAVEADFAKMEKAGVKMIRVINYTLDDMALPDPTEAPTVTVSNDGGLNAGSYIYRYTCANLSKHVIGQTGNIYDTAETLPSPITSSINITQGQKATLTLAPCAKSYRYLVYRRNSEAAVDSETYLGFAEAPAGENATFTDNGSYRPSGVWADPTVAPTLQTQAKDPAAKTDLAPDTYIYRYGIKEQQKPGNGIWDKFVEGSLRTLVSPTSEITVGTGQVAKLTVVGDIGPWIPIYRRKASDPQDSEKFLATVRNVNGTITFIDDGSRTLSTLAIPSVNNTIQQSMPTTNETHDNPRTQWPTGKSTAFMTGFGNWNEDALVASDKVMALAKKYNIRIMFTLVDQHDNNTGGVREIARNCGTWNTNFFADTCSKDMYKEIIDKFTERTNTVTGIPYKDDPAIFAWEFINEPWETNSGGGFRNWIWEMGRYLKNNDPNHMLSSGDDGSVWFTHNYEAAYNANNNHDFVMMGTPDPIDLLTFHGYPESTGFVFNHGYYGEFNPTDPTKRGSMTDTQAAAWIDKWGPVNGPIDIAGTIKEMQRRTHYAYLLNKPIVFGEWGLGQHEIGKDNNGKPIMETNWKLPSANDWIADISDAILTIKPDLVRSTDAIPDGDFSDNLTDNWNINPPNTAYFEKDESKTFNGHPSVKLTPTHILDSAQAWQYRNGVVSKKFPIKPNTTYWYEYTYINPTDNSLSFRVKYYKNGQDLNQSLEHSVGTTASINNVWRTVNRFNGGRCEFTTPDANEAEIVIDLINGREVDGDKVWIGDINIYELVTPTTENVGSTFASTGWWGTDVEYSRDALVYTAKNFALASVASLPPLYESGEDPVKIDPGTDPGTPPETDPGTSTNPDAPKLVPQEEKSITGDTSEIDGVASIATPDDSANTSSVGTDSETLPSQNIQGEQGHGNLGINDNSEKPVKKNNSVVILITIIGLVIATAVGYYLYTKREVTKDL